jgi:putative phosphonate transport system ATP-binding protein
MIAAIRPPVLVADHLHRLHGRAPCGSCLSLTGSDSNTCSRCGTIVAVADVGLRLHSGEILGIMGESGSGKSSLVRLLHLDDRATSGTATFTDRDDHNHSIFSLDGARARRLRNIRFGMVHQNPQLGLNMRVSAGGNIAERLLTSGEMSFTAIRSRAEALLERVEIPLSRIDDAPGTFSGGMQQRLQIARALAPNPELLFLDEVTTGLDLSVQARILDLILSLREDLGVSMIVVTHDLGVVRLLADRTLVMRYGRVVEAGITDQILEDPQHPYTQQLVMSSL